MTVDLFVSQLNKISEEELLKSLKNRDKSKKHIIIAPDRCTLNIEKKLFDILDEECLVGLDVLTFSRLAKIELNKSNINEKVLTKNSAVAIIKKILLDNEKSLENFSKAIKFNGFSSELYNTICLFKSCNIESGDIDIQTKEKALNLKLSDIKFVYEKYEEFLKQDYTDSFNRLSLFASKINKDTFKDTCFYFVCFEDFTKQQYLIIEKLIRFAQSVSFACTWSKASSKIANANIYLNAVFYGVMDLCSQVGVCPNIKKIVNDENVLLNNFLSLSVDKDFSKDLNSFEKEGYKLYKYSSVLDEVKHIVADIKFKIINENLGFKDFSIVVPNIDGFSKMLIKEFDKYGIMYYLDSSDKLNENYIVRILLSILNILTGDFDKYDVLAYLKSPFANFSQEKVYAYENYINRYGLMGKALLGEVKGEIFESFDKILTQMEEFSLPQTVEDFVEGIRKFLSNIGFYVNLENYLKDNLEKNELILFRKNRQVIERVDKAFDELGEVFKDNICSFEEFLELFKAYIEDATLVLPPISLDAVFVGDYNKSFFERNKYVYIIGANEGVMPSYNLDTGIITDRDISNLSNKNKLNPTVAVINKRKRFKVYENLFIGEHTIISYHESGESGEEAYSSVWLDSISKILGLKVIDGSSELDMISSSRLNLDIKNVVFNNFNEETAKDNFIFLIKQWQANSNNKNFVTLTSSLNSALNNKSKFSNFVLDNLNYQNKVPKLIDAKDIYFKNGKCSISEVERFYHCPYEHFVDYGLRLEENKQSEISAMDNGNILHEYLRLIVPKVVKNFENEEFLSNIETIAKNTISYVLERNEDYDYIVKNPKLSYFVDSLKNEAVRIIKALIYQQKNSKFIPNENYLEYAFDKKGETIEFEAGGKKLVVKGFIDRVDIFEDGFRIIDYKTGKTSSTFKDFSDLVNGKKIQLFVYLMAFEKVSKLKPLGAFYMPILNSFEKEDSLSLYKLQGIIENSLETLFASDMNLKDAEYQSKIIDVKTDKNGLISKNNRILSMEQLKELSNFAFNLLKGAVERILSGEIAPNPLGKDYFNSSCKLCKFKAICGFNELYGNTIRDEIKISRFEDFENFIKGGDEIE